MLAEAIEDNPQNYTRFVVIAKEPQVHEKCDKTSVVFTTPNEPGALFEVLKLAAECEVNVIKLESRPIPGRPWGVHVLYGLRREGRSARSPQAPGFAPRLDREAQGSRFLSGGLTNPRRSMKG